MTRRNRALQLTALFAAFAVLVSGAAMLCLAPSFAAAADFTPARWIGFYEPGAPQSMGPLTTVEGELGTHVGVTTIFRSIAQPFTDSEVENAADHGSIPLITLEICDEYGSGDITQSNYTLKKITSGTAIVTQSIDGKPVRQSIDAVLTKYADDARDSGHEIWIRPLHEMNGNWYPWGGTVNTNQPADFIPAWRHIHDIFARENATNVKFVWCPNIESLSTNSAGSTLLNAAGNRIADYYPGDAYVDYVALDGYNPSSTIDGLKWRSFTSLFGAPYDTVASISSKPIFIAETASVSNGGDKAAWIVDMFSVIPMRFPRVVGVSWFNQGTSRQDWPIDSSSVSLQAFRLGVANGTFAPGLKLNAVHSGVSIKASAKSVRRRHAFTLSGVLTPGQYHDTLRVNVTIPKHRGSHRYVLTNSWAGWSMRYTPTVRGCYYVRVTYAGDATRQAGVSKTIKIVVK
ncbi:MAG: glycosyl hydrolase [Coriobacteriia bacterium]|nr:glycosyl hydrolase [Coriobacteriia bacterium]